MAHKPKKSCLPLFASKEMSTRATIRCRLTTIKMTIIKKSDDNECCWGPGEIETLILWRCPVKWCS